MGQHQWVCMALQWLGIEELREELGLLKSLG